MEILGTFTEVQTAHAKVPLEASVVSAPYVPEILVQVTNGRRWVTLLRCFIHDRPFWCRPQIPRQQCCPHLEFYWAACSTPALYRYLSHWLRVWGGQVVEVRAGTALSQHNEREHKDHLLMLPEARAEFA